MMLPIAFVLACLAPAAPDDSQVDLVTVLAQRGWIDLAGELSARIDHLPGAAVAQAEVAAARARQEPDLPRAASQLDAAIARLLAHPTPDERAMAGRLVVQKAALLHHPQAWEEAEAFFRTSVGALQALPHAEEALLDARLELAKAIAARARAMTADEALRRNLLGEAVLLFLDIQLDTSRQPLAFEAILEEGRARMDLRDYGRAESCFRAVLALKKKGVALSGYLRALHDGAFLGLLRTLAAAGKGNEAALAADLFAKEEPARATSAFGLAVLLAKAQGLFAAARREEAIALAQTIVGLNPRGAAGAAARGLIQDWTKDGATGAQLLLVADGLMDRGLFQEALVAARRSVELCRTSSEREHVEPSAAFKRGECFRELRRDAEASVAFQELFRRYPQHELAPRAALEAVRALLRSASRSRDRRDLDQEEALLQEVQERSAGGPFAEVYSFLQAEILERKGQWKAAAQRYQAVGPGSEGYDDALVSAAHCLRRDAEAGGDPKERAIAEKLLRTAAVRLEKAANPRLLAVAQFELAAILLETHPKDALEFLERCAAPLPAESEMLPRLAEMEIRARLNLGDLSGASARLERLLQDAGGGAAAARSCRRVSSRLEATDPAKAAIYDRAWLEATQGEDAPAGEVQPVADRLYRLARILNKLPGNVVSVLDLRGQPVLHRPVWADAARALERLRAAPRLSDSDRHAADARLVTCEGMLAESAAGWTAVKKRCEGLIQEFQLVDAGGLKIPVLLQERWLAGVYLEYGHALYQLGRAGQKFQFTNALTAFWNLGEISEKGSEPWWLCRWMEIRIVAERGEGNDLRHAAAAMSSLSGNYPEFDGGKFGMKALLVDLQEQLRAAEKPPGR